jgi:cation:H+ antiporter
MLLDIFAIIAGLIILILGAEGLVRGSSSLAAKLKISPLVIGLTVVSFGTSAPELTVNIVAAINNAPDLAVGNVVGSNIANIFLILGISALIVPLAVKSSTVWKEIPLALLGVGLLLIMGNDQFFDGVSYNTLTRTDGIALLALMVIFMYYVFGLAKADRAKKNEIAEVGAEVHQYSLVTSASLTIIGLVGLIIGGRMLVSAAVNVAQSAGLSEALIGLTIVAIGTSLPELATSIMAAIKKHADIAIGNAVGSNIFNIFFVLGATSTILPLPITGAISIDIMVAILATFLLFVFMFLGHKHRLTRWEGGVFVALYISYLGFLVVRG